MRAKQSPPLLGAQQTFGRRVRARRTELGLTLEELGEVSGLHWTYLSQIELGKRNISFGTIVRLAAALGSNPGELMNGLKP